MRSCLVLCILLTLATRWSAEAACACVLDQPELGRFCQSHYVVVGKVVKEEEPVCQGDSCSVRVYSFNIEKVIKKPHAKESPKKKLYVETAYVSEGCGITLREGEYYVVGGIIRNQKVWTSMCDYAKHIPKDELEEAYIRLKDYDAPNACRGLIIDNRWGQTREYEGGMYRLQVD